MINKRTNNNWLLALMMVLLLCLTIPITSVGTAKADTTVNQELQNIIDNTYFITFKKSDTPDRGKNVVACFYIPKTVYNPSYKYGTIIFPKDYGTRFGINSDYFNEAKEQGITIASIEPPYPIYEDDGYGYNCGITNIREANLSRTFAFVFYVHDGQGNYAYLTPQYADYNSLIAGTYTDEELKELTKTVVDMNDSFYGIVTKIEELTNAVWIYLLIAFGSVVVVWGSYIGIKIIIAKKNEEKINSRDMVKRLIIGVIVMALIAVCCPLFISGLSHWILW